MAITLTDEEFLDVFTKHIFPGNKKIFILITTPSCTKCREIKKEENWEKIEEALEGFPARVYEFNGKNREAADLLESFHLMSVPSGIVVDAVHDKIHVAENAYTRVEEILIFLKSTFNQ
jgi:hypothetical protein